MNEIRNELLILLQLAKATDEKDKKFQLEWLLERFENDIKRQLDDLKYKTNELERNLETLNYVKQELNIITK